MQENHQRRNMKTSNRENNQLSLFNRLVISALVIATLFVADLNSSSLLSALISIFWLWLPEIEKIEKRLMGGKLKSRRVHNTNRFIIVTASVLTVIYDKPEVAQILSLIVTLAWLFLAEIERLEIKILKGT
jgi:hypothetical protein